MKDDIATTAALRIMEWHKDNGYAPVLDVAVSIIRAAIQESDAADRAAHLIGDAGALDMPDHDCMVEIIRGAYQQNNQLQTPEGSSGSPG